MRCCQWWLACVYGTACTYSIKSFMKVTNHNTYVKIKDNVWEFWWTKTLFDERKPFWMILLCSNTKFWDNRAGGWFVILTYIAQEKYDGMMFSQTFLNLQIHAQIHPFSPQDRHWNQAVQRESTDRSPYQTYTLAKQLEKISSFGRCVRAYF